MAMICKARHRVFVQWNFILILIPVQTETKEMISLGFGLADVMLINAEAILRGAAPTTVSGELETPEILVNKVRTRAKATQVTSVDLGGLLNERVWEFSWEAWRRNDLIRYGLFEEKWGFKDDADINKRIHSVPSSEISLNPNLQQNPGH